MSVYVVAQLSIHDRAAYDRYASRFLDVLGAFGGRLLAADESPTVLEGSWEHEKVVLLEFTDRDEFARWSSSQDYVTIARDRQLSTTGCVLLVDASRSAGVGSA